MCSFFRMSFEATRDACPDNQNDKYPLRFTRSELDQIAFVLEKYRRFGKLARHILCPSSQVTAIVVLDGQARNNCVMIMRKFFHKDDGMFMYGLASSRTKENLTTPNISSLLQFAEYTLDKLPQVGQPTLQIF